MKTRLLNMLACPVCKNNFSLNAFSAQQNDTADGLLVCQGCGESFPVIDNIPRILLGELRRDLIFAQHKNFFAKYKNQLPDNILAEYNKSTATSGQQQTSLKIKTAKSFGYEWNTFLGKKFLSQNTSYKRDFIEWISPINKEFFPGKIVLDAGSGVGRHAYWSANFGAKEVIGIDLSEAVQASYNNTKHLPNVHIIQADIYKLPFRPIFDYIYCIGVLHHLPNPEQGFRSLSSLLKPKGIISIWVYGRRHNFFHVYFNETIRLISKKIPFKILHPLCYFPAIGVALLNIIYKFLNHFAFTKFIAQLIPLKIYADLPFIAKLNDTFDIFATPKSSYWKKEEIENWYKQAGFKNYSVAYVREKSLKAYGSIE